MLDRLEEAWHQHVLEISGPLPELPSVEDLEVQEGGSKQITTLQQQRSRWIIECAKSRAVARDGKLLCCAYGFDFEAAYGVRGGGYIEGHHEIPVSTLTEGSTTKVSDIKLICANCHRMIHRKKDEWLTINELKTIMADAKAST